MLNAMFVFLIFLSLSTIPFGGSSSICGAPFNFSFPSFDSTSCGNGGNLNCMGAVSVSNGSLIMTPDDDKMDEIARVLYRYPMNAWPASMCTTFTIRILKDPNSPPTKHGDGMSFVLAQDSSPSAPKSYGSYLGIFDGSTAGVLHQTAVEFDTYKNEFEPDANHIAIDTVSISDPVAYKALDSLGIDLASGRDITVRIEYDGWNKSFQIYASYEGPENLVSVLNHTLELQKLVPNSVYVGFTAATGPLSETHQVLSWNFTTIVLPKESLANEDHEDRNLLMIVVPAAVVGFSLLVVLCLYPFILRYHRREMERLAKKGDIESLIAAANGPKLYSFKKLSKATRNFNKSNLLGTGGFGSVYKGTLSGSPPTTIAVKKISATSKQGEKEYLSEICTIGRLKHKNLVQLQGWCHERNQLLLVYEYMPNGSLDRFIGKDSNAIVLDWATRHRILAGLASALLYLHEECGHPVVHRDVKPNNVMLDSDFNAHLGDFGLARLFQNEVITTTMVAGTPGYLAPEVSFTGRATPESDVYSFGMVVLELVCGKRSKGIVDEDSLVDSVWNSYEKETLLECVDKSLQGRFDEEQVKKIILVGLSCLHPDLMLRPKMRKVVQTFMNTNESLINVPKSRPLSVCLSLVPSNSISTTTEFGYSVTPHGVSTESSPEEMVVPYIW